MIAHEVGVIERFPSAGQLASHAGTTPRVQASGGRVHLGQLRADVNRYLKWAFVEAANAVACHRRGWSKQHVVRLYERVRGRKGHQTAVGAVARHLAEATFWVLKRKEGYREPQRRIVSSTERQARGGS